jgi:ribonuclease HI
MPPFNRNSPTPTILQRFFAHSVLTKLNDGEEIVHDRKLVLCPTIKDWSVPELLRECPNCKAFLLYCCGCNNRLQDLPQSRRPAKPCHHYRIVFTDGACTNNGLPAAKAGVGVAYGSDDSSQLSQPITDTDDNFPQRSNQGAELCAANIGVEFLGEAYNNNPKSGAEIWIVATDSEYVVKGMTEWLPTWKVKIFQRTCQASLKTMLTQFIEEQLAYIQRYYTSKSGSVPCSRWRDGSVRGEGCEG